ncbi:Arm DNA-binding domain-containing protein [Vibrio campbellii]
MHNSRGKGDNLCEGQGLLLRIRPSERQAWLFNYRKPKDNKRTNILIAKYPSVTISQHSRKGMNSYLCWHKD